MVGKWYIYFTILIYIFSPVYNQTWSDDCTLVSVGDTFPRSIELSDNKSVLVLINKGAYTFDRKCNFQNIQKDSNDLTTDSDSILFRLNDIHLILVRKTKIVVLNEQAVVIYDHTPNPLIDNTGKIQYAIIDNNNFILMWKEKNGYIGKKYKVDNSLLQIAMFSITSSDSGSVGIAGVYIKQLDLLLVVYPMDKGLQAVLYNSALNIYDYVTPNIAINLKNPQLIPIEKLNFLLCYDYIDSIKYYSCSLVELNDNKILIFSATDRNKNIVDNVEQYHQYQSFLNKKTKSFFTIIPKSDGFSFQQYTFGIDLIGNKINISIGNLNNSLFSLGQDITGFIFYNNKNWTIRMYFLPYCDDVILYTQRYIDTKISLKDIVKTNVSNPGEPKIIIYDLPTTAILSLNNNFIVPKTEYTIKEDFSVMSFGKDIALWTYTGHYETYGSYQCKLNIQICHLTCASCKSTGDATDHKCDTCFNGYYKKEGDTLEICYNESTKPSNYYLDKDIYKKCYDSCNSCETGGNADLHNCIECLPGYFPIDNGVTKPLQCLKTIPSKYFFDMGEKQQFKRCFERCDSCTSLGTAKDNKCLTCATDYEVSPYDKTQCLSKCNGKKWYYDPTTNNRVCVDTIPTEYPILVESNQQLVKSCSPFNNDYCIECHKQAMFEYTKGTSKTCVTTCPRNEDLTESYQTFTCTKTSGGGDSDLAKECPNYCLTEPNKCSIPEKTCKEYCKADADKCDLREEICGDTPGSDCSFKPDPTKRLTVYKEDNNFNSYFKDLTWSDDLIDKYFKKIVYEEKNNQQFINLIYHNRFTDYSISYYKLAETSLQSQLYSKHPIAIIDFSSLHTSLENKQMRMLETTTESLDDYHVMQFDIHRPDDPTNQTEYMLYYQKGTDSTTRKMVEVNKYSTSFITMQSPMNKEDNPYIKMSETMFKKDIDIFNQSSLFYNDVCFRYITDNNRDTVIPDRREVFYPKKELCENNCKYISYDTINKKVNCKCSVKSFIPFSTDIFGNPPANAFPDKDYQTYTVAKCIMEVFDASHIVINAAFWVYLSCCVTMVVLAFCFICVGMDYASKYINEVLKSTNTTSSFIACPPPKTLPPKEGTSDRDQISDIEEAEFVEMKINNFQEGRNPSNRQNYVNTPHSKTEDNSSMKSKENQNKLIMKLKEALNGEFDPSANPNMYYFTKNSENESNPNYTKDDGNEVLEMGETGKIPNLFGKYDKVREMLVYGDDDFDEKGKGSLQLSAIDNYGNQKAVKDVVSYKNETHKLTLQNKAENVGNSQMKEDDIDVDVKTAYSFCRAYYNYTKRREIFFVTFCSNKSYLPFFITFPIFLFCMTIMFTIHALFYTNGYIHDRYVQEGSISFSFWMEKEFSKCLYIALIGNVVKIIIIKILIFLVFRIEKKMLTKKNHPVILQRLRCRSTTIFVILIIVMGVLFYINTCFCGIFENNQDGLFIGYIISIFFSFLFGLVICLIINGIRAIGISCNCS